MSKQTILASAANITTNYLPRYNGTGYVDSVLYDNGTNVGIGTTSPNIGGYGANSRLLTVQGVSGSYGILELTSNSANADGSAIGRLDFGSDGQAANYKAISSIASFLSGSTSTKFGADLRFYTRANNAASGDPTERMRINSTGQVGIGTSSFTGFNSTDLVLRVQQSSGISAVQAISGDSGAGVWLYSGANSSDFPSIIFKRDLRFGSATDLGTGGYSERMRITSGGAINIKDGTLTGGGGFEFTSEAFFGARFQSNAYKFMAGNNSTEYMRITSGGNVNIGGNAGIGRLQVWGENQSSANFAMYVYNSGGFGLFGIRNDGAHFLSSFTYNNTVSGGTRNVFIDNSFALGGISSIRASKKNIQEFTSEWIYDLKPVQFNYRKKDKEGNYIEEYFDEITYGLIAEDTEPIADFLINYNDKEDGTKEMVGIEYMRLITPMLKSIQEQKKLIDELNTKVTDQQEQINQLINK